MKLSVEPDGKNYALAVPSTKHEKTYETRAQEVDPAKTASPSIIGGPWTSTLTPEQALLRDTARDLANKEIAPRAAAIDKEHRFPARADRPAGRAWA